MEKQLNEGELEEVQFDIPEDSMECMALLSLSGCLWSRDSCNSAGHLCDQVRLKRCKEMP